MCCRVIKTKVIELAVIVYQSLYLQHQKLRLQVRREQGLQAAEVVVTAPGAGEAVVE